VGVEGLSLWDRWRAVMMHDLGVPTYEVAVHLGVEVADVEAAIEAEKARRPTYDLTEEVNQREGA
jgi:hypothetical protein